jgi:pimeloyl-ACP methyl ester carboxylesterase
VGTGRRTDYGELKDKLRLSVPRIREDFAEANISMWTEAFFGAEMLLLHMSPTYYGFGVPKGDESGVVVIPGFLGTDFYLSHLHSWLGRIGYRAYFSGIGLNADCPNLLIQRCLSETMERALDETGRPVHLIGHSLGGIIARSVAAQRPRDVASVIMMAAPFRGNVAHKNILRAAEVVRQRILDEHGSGVLPSCYTARCTCNFLDSLRHSPPPSVPETAIYTKNDGIVDWRYCRTQNPKVDFEVTGTHIGLVFNPAVYNIVATRLAEASSK